MKDRPIYKLTLIFSTGGDDLRGKDDVLGTNNVDLVLNLIDGRQQIYRNLNHDSRWTDQRAEGADVTLQEPVLLSQIRNLVISTTSGGGLSGDNWDMNSLSISTPNSTLAGATLTGELLQVGFKRFTGDDNVLILPIIHTMRDVARGLNIYTLKGIQDKLLDENLPNITSPGLPGYYSLRFVVSIYRYYVFSGLITSTSS